MSSRKSTRVVVETDLEVVEIADGSQSVASHERDDPRPSADSVASFPLIEPSVAVNSRGLARHASSPALGSGQLHSSDRPSAPVLPPLSGADGAQRRNREHQLPLSRRQQSNASDSASTARDSSALDAADFASSSEVDWYGNSSLHQIFARSPVDLATLSALLQAHPQLARLQNQFGRLPLHYALDRSRVSEAGVRMLLAAFPAAAAVRDHQGETPYDLALRWQHSRSMLRLLLESCPDIDRDAFVRMRYGPLGSLAVWASSFGAKKGDDEDDAAVAEEAALIARDAACCSLPSISPCANDATQSCQTQSHSIFTDCGSREHTPRAAVASAARSAAASPRPCVASDDDRVVTFTAE
eukprot:gene13258-9499_t